MSKALRTAALIVTAVALVATGIGAAAGATLIGVGAGATATVAGISAATFTAVGAIAGAAAAGLSLLAAATAKKPAVSISGNQTSFTASLDQGLPWLIGTTRSAGCCVHDITYDSSSTTNNALQTFFGVWSADQCDGLVKTEIDNNATTFGLEAGGTVPDSAQGLFHSWMWHRYQLGHSPEPAALTATGFYPYPPGWSADAKLSGCAAFAWTLRFDTEGNVYPSGVVPQKRDTLRGALAWDPRHDDTYPGGAGPQRRDDPSTWAFTENPFLIAMKWARGIWQNGKKVMGIGMALASINIDSAVQCANVADANNWKVGGVVYSTDPKYDVLKKILAAGSGEPMRVGGMLHFICDAPRVSLATVTNDDIIGKPSVPNGPAMRDKMNSCIPTFRDPTNDWQLVPAAKIVVADYVTADGRPRTKSLTWELVQDSGQLGELATYAICNSREIDGIQLPLKLKWIGYKPGDAVTIAASVVAMDSQLVVLRKRHIDPASSAITFTSRTETTSKHPFALGKTATPPPAPALATTDRTQLLQPGITANWSKINDDNGQLAALKTSAATAERQGADALGDLANIASKGILSRGAKPRVEQDWKIVYEEHDAVAANATALGVSSALIGDYLTKLNNTAVMLTSLSPNWLDDTQDSPIPTNWIDTWAALYGARTTLYFAMWSQAAQKATWDQIADPNGGKAALITLAGTAQRDATAALGKIADIASDGILSTNEKRPIIQDWLSAVAEHGYITAQAQRAGVGYSAYDGAINALSTELGSLLPAWDDVTQNTPLPDPGGFTNAWVNYYSQRTLLLDAMSAQAQGISIQTSANLFTDARFERSTSAEWQQFTGWVAEPAGGQVYSPPNVGDDCVALCARYAVNQSTEIDVDVDYFLGSDVPAGGVFGIATQFFRQDGSYITGSGIAINYADAARGAWLHMTGRIVCASLPGSESFAFAQSYLIAQNHSAGGVFMRSPRGLRVVTALKNIGADGRALSSDVQSTNLLVGATNTVSAICTATDQGGGTGAVITVPAHVRTYAGASGQAVISYNGGTLPNCGYDTTYFVYCDDPGLKGGAVTYFATTNADELTYNSGRYHVATIRTPIAGAAATAGSGGAGASSEPTYGGTPTAPEGTALP